MFRSSYQIARIWGIPIKVHISLIILLGLMAFSMAVVDGIRAVPLVLSFEILLFTSIALHELAHSYVAIRKGCRVREITLLFLGCAAQMERIPTKPKDEFLMAMAGPALSIFLGVACILVGQHLHLPQTYWPLPFVHRRVLRNLVEMIGVVNLVLAGFNLLPSFPMDGGRILRAILTPRMGRLKATLVASRIGKIMAILFGLYAVYTYALFLVAIAFFVYILADNEYRMVRHQEAARKFGVDSCPPPAGGGHGDDADDHVRISPPPYEEGPGSETRLREERDDDNPFGKMFRR